MGFKAYLSRLLRVTDFLLKVAILFPNIERILHVPKKADKDARYRSYAVLVSVEESCKMFSYCSTQRQPTIQYLYYLPSNTTPSSSQP